MMTVKEVSTLTGVSVRTLHHYDHMGLLPATTYTDAGYRMYDEAALKRLQQIMLFRELEFPLMDIKEILDNPNFDRGKALEQQLHLLQLKRAHLDNLIAFLRGIQQTGEQTMNFQIFNHEQQKQYAAEAKSQWGSTTAYKEYEENSKGRSADIENALGKGLMSIFEEFGQIKSLKPDSPAAQALVHKLQSYITEHYYNCTKEILSGLGAMYAAGGEFTENIDAVGGEGTAAFAAAAIAAYIK